MNSPYFIRESREKNVFSHMYWSLKEKVEVRAKRKKIIVLAGPTGVGKTDLSISIAKILDGEIISADSMQVYRGMDIGTAKVSKDIQKEVVHHMIDVCDIDKNFNVVEFYNQAHMICSDILLRDKIPIVVGGSGFYMHAFLYGPPEGPPSMIEIREKLSKQMDLLGPEALYEKLKELDPNYAKSLTPNDKHKIVRALEIITITKKPVSSFPKPKQIPSDTYDYRCWFMHMPKELLYPIVDMRCMEMIERGFIDEVEDLMKKGLEENYSASQAIGYRQCIEYLKSNKQEADRIKFINNFKQATRHYIKRQFTWFKKEPFFRWLDLSQISRERALEYILQDYEQK